MDRGGETEQIKQISRVGWQGLYRAVLSREPLSKRQREASIHALITTNDKPDGVAAEGRGRKGKEGERGSCNTDQIIERY